jgi:hypothetical protein
MSFVSPDHLVRFRHNGVHHERGSLGTAICGARLRTGAPCPNPPIREGKGRCLSHAGPKAARAFRERQKRAVEAGSISAEEWNRAEARRAANRQGDQWKKNPWLHGSTIDLGGHEVAFRDAMGARDVDALPPAVADWLRWRYRRTQIDRQGGGAWLQALRMDLPRRVADAGPRPVEAPGREPMPGCQPRTWVADADAAGGASRRALPDRPCAPKVRRGKGYARPGRPRAQPADAEEFEGLMRVYREHAGVLEPIMAAAQGEARQLAVLRTLPDYLARPGDVGACQRWLALVGAARVR